MEKFLKVALEAAHEAGAVLLAEHSRPQKISYKGDVDLVTETDKRSEALIVGRLRREFPEHRIVAEEGSSGAAAVSVKVWLAGMPIIENTRRLTLQLTVTSSTWACSQ